MGEVLAVRENPLWGMLIYSSGLKFYFSESTVSPSQGLRL